MWAIKNPHRDTCEREGMANITSVTMIKPQHGWVVVNELDDGTIQVGTANSHHLRLAPSRLPSD